MKSVPCPVKNRFYIVFADQQSQSVADRPHRDPELVHLRAVDVDMDMDNRHRCRFGRLLVSRIVAGNDRARTLTGILTRWSRGIGRRSGGQFTSARWRGIN
jgi:hypothetical protein